MQNGNKHGELTKEAQYYVFLICLVFSYILVCTIFYSYYEGWHTSIAMFFAFETMTAVGYGHHTPSDDRSRLFTIFAMITGVYMVFGAVATAVTYRLQYFKSKLRYLDLDRVEEIHRELDRRVAINIVAAIICLFLATAVFIAMEGWTFPTALYFTVQTAMGIGYGDIELKQHGTHIVVGIFTLFSVILVAFAITNITDAHQERRHLRKMLTIAQQKQALSRLQELDTSNGVSRDTFVLAVLEQLGVLDRDTHIEPWIRKFAEFDLTDSGVLRATDLVRFGEFEYWKSLAEVQRLEQIDRATALPDPRATFREAVSLVSTGVRVTIGRRSEQSHGEGGGSHGAAAQAMTDLKVSSNPILTRKPFDGSFSEIA